MLQPIFIIREQIDGNRQTFTYTFGLHVPSAEEGAQPKAVVELVDD